MFIKTVPDDGNEEELAIVRLVTLAFIPDDSVDVNWPDLKPLQGPSPHPVDADSTAGPTGTPTGDYFEGKIYEIIIFNKELTASDRTLVDNYLKTKYGIS